MSRAPRTTEKRESVDEYLASWHATMKFLREGRSFSGRERNRAFLNCGGSAFANVSSVSGLDFEDDGRALATVDWDQDGDLDVWLYNRTGPRLRMMQNQTISRAGDSGNGFLSIKLRGTQSNRDAIGARVQVVLKDQPPMVQTVYAGDGYLSQSSKSLHFGLGVDAKIEQLNVRWPNGTVEQFTGVESNRRYLIVEGSGRAEQVARAELPTNAARSDVAPSTQVSTASTSTARVVLANRMPMPILEPDDYDGTRMAAIEAKGRPLLVNFWASWCAPCVKELEEWTEQSDTLRKQGVDLLALSVDGMGAEGQGTPAESKALLQRIEFPFSHAMANAKLIDKLAVVQRIVFNQNPPFAVPTSFLLDGEGQLAVIYRGTVSAKVLMDDIRRLETPVAQRRDLAVPFQGTWSSRPRTLLLGPVATVFKERGYLNDYARFVELDLERRNQQRSVAQTEKEKRRVDGEFATTQFNLGRTLQSYGKRSEAISHFRQGLEVKPDDGLAHYHLARLLVGEKDIKAASEHFQRSIEIEPDSVQPHFHFGVLLANQKRTTEAAKHFRRAIEIRPDHVDALTNLGVLLAAEGQLKDAIPLLARAVKVRPDHFEARMNYGGALSLKGDVGAAVEEYKSAVKIQPDVAVAHVRLARLLLSTKDEAGAAYHFEKAIALRPSDGASMLRLAWILATSEKDQLRDGQRARSLAEEVNAATGGKDPRALDVLAAAYAEVGDFSSAVTNAKEALDRLDGKTAGFAAAIQERLILYRSSNPYREK